MPGLRFARCQGKRAQILYREARAGREKLIGLLVKQRNHDRNGDPFLILPVLGANLAAMKI